MDFGNAIKAAPTSFEPPPARTDVGAAKASVAVELPPEQTVQSASAGDAVRVEVRARDEARQAQQRTRDKTNDARQRDVDLKAASRREQDVSEQVDRRLVIEPQTRSIVIQKRDRDTGETVEIVPDAATLKLRIYARQLAERNQSSSEGRYVEKTA